MISKDIREIGDGFFVATVPEGAYDFEITDFIRDLCGYDIDFDWNHEEYEKRGTIELADISGGIWCIIEDEKIRKEKGLTSETEVLLKVE